MRIVRNRTKEIVNEVPIEKINWRLTEHSMSIIEIIHHIASVEKAVWGSSLKHKKTGYYSRQNTKFTIEVLFMPIEKFGE